MNRDSKQIKHFHSEMTNIFFPFDLSKIQEVLKRITFIRILFHHTHHLFLSIISIPHDIIYIFNILDQIHPRVKLFLFLIPY